jgi:putative protein-disulfide isomerase
METELLYVADPMCSWCFAFAPQLEQIQTDLRPGIGFRIVLGGLAPDDDTPMSQEMCGYIKSAWRSIEERTSTRFNWDYWDHNQPSRSTWPACRAVLAASPRGPEMFQAIQRAYYQEAKDPSKLDVLLAIASDLAFDVPSFATAIQAPVTREALQQEFQLRDQLGARSFPSVALRQGEQLTLLTSGWVEEAALRDQLGSQGLLRTD